jgi:16S rRNA processing protein RimM
VAQRWVSVGRVGKAHGRDGSFYVDDPEAQFPEGSQVVIASLPRRVMRRKGTDSRPLLQVGGIDDRAEAINLQGEQVKVLESSAPLGSSEWRSEDLIGCHIEGIGEVRRVVSGPSCDLLEVGPQASLVPFVADAIRQVDVKQKLISVNYGFLGLGGPVG